MTDARKNASEGRARGQPPAGAAGGIPRGVRLTLALWILLHASIAGAQSPPLSSSQSAERIRTRQESPIHKGATEWSWLSGGAAGIAGGGGDSSFWSLQGRWGRVLTGPHGPGFLRGTLEYAFEIVPAFVIAQSTTVYGAGFNPLLLQYNFTRSRRFVPFLQLGGGLLFTTKDVPENTSQFNFTPQGGIGAYWFLRPRSAMVFGVRFHHISNASTADRNPGHNSLYFYTGISWWR